MLQLKGCMRATRKVRVITRTCKCEFEKRINYTNHLTNTVYILNVCTETIGFTIFRKIFDEHEHI